jgi:hypothetical protein
MLDLGLNTHHDFIYASPLVLVLSSAADNTERFKNVYDIIDAPPLNT